MGVVGSEATRSSAMSQPRHMLTCQGIVSLGRDMQLGKMFELSSWKQKLWAEDKDRCTDISFWRES